MKKKKPNQAKVIGATLQSKKARFLQAYRQLGTVLRAAEATGVTRQAHYLWLEGDEYARDFKLACEDYLDKLAAEADRRAVEGIDHPVTYEGQITDTYKDYSDTLLMFRMKRLDPNYRERTEIKSEVMLTGEVKHKHEFDYGEFERLNFEINRRIAQGLASAGGGIAQGNGHRQPLDTPHTNGKTGEFPS